MSTLMGNEVITNKKYTLVYEATHRGDERLPYMNRSFISFSYGGKNIEDFNLIATINGDRMEREGYSSFEDITTTYDNLPGLLYWNTHYKTNSIDFTLATDGIDLKQLDNFLYWFSAGVCRELILAEHPNRALLARVAEPPQLHLLPFESNIEIKITNRSYKTKTTLYKGEINLKLVMDSPHWYSIHGVLGKLITEGNESRYINEWIDTNGNAVNIFASLDALKILYEDGIPLGSMIQANMLLGNKAYANVETKAISRVWSTYNSVDDFINNPLSINWSSWTPTNELGEGARIEPNQNPPRTLGIIAGAIINANGNGISSLAEGLYGYFYYSGTAPAPTIITFTMTPVFDEWCYIVEPYNKKSSKNYNTITIESIHELKLCFTTPNLYTSYNKAQDIFRKYLESGNKTNFETIREHLRDEVRHTAVRNYANYVLDLLDNNFTVSDAVINLLKIFYKTDVSANPESVIFSFNSETGEAIGKFLYRTINGNSIKFELHEEDVGDMLRSNYIIIRDRNHPTENGTIISWEDTDENTKGYSHRIYHDIPGGITNFSILYKNMYL